MNIWIQITIAAEVFAVASILMAIITRRVNLIFAFGFNVMLPVILIYLLHAQTYHLRIIIGVAVALLYLFRLNWVILVWTRNTAMSKLSDALALVQKIGLAVVMANAVAFGYCLPFYFVSQNQSPLNWIDYLAIGIYVVGSYIHFKADYEKKVFKERPDSKGKVLNTGLWSLCRHPNYFGDFLIYVSFAVLAQNLYAWVSPLLCLLQYLFDAIPKSEKWALEKYGTQWEEYKKNTSSAFILYPKF